MGSSAKVNLALHMIITVSCTLTSLQPAIICPLMELPTASLKTSTRCRPLQRALCVKSCFTHYALKHNRWSPLGLYRLTEVPTLIEQNHTRPLLNGIEQRSHSIMDVFIRTEKDRKCNHYQ